jgi:hypothetical protein
MFPRIAILATLTLSLVFLPGCPGGRAPVGSWIITWSGIDYGLQLNANGEAVPFMVDSNLVGTFTWEVDGTRVLMHHVNQSGKRVWVAELTSDTTMSGAWVGWFGQGVLGASNTWTAVKTLPT